MMVKGGLLLFKDVGLENLTNLSFGNKLIEIPIY
jgi:hypothetical protein